MSAEPSTEPSSDAAHPAPRGGLIMIRITGAIGAVLGYGFLAAFLYLICLQVYRWFRSGEWTHVGVADALRGWLGHCCVKDGDTGRLATLLHWLDAPVDWLGLHKLLEILPVSVALLALSILGNSIFIYCRDKGGGSPDHR